MEKTSWMLDMESRLDFPITVLELVVQELLEQEPVTKWAHTLAACADVLRDIQLDMAIPDFHPTSGNGSPSSQTATTKDVPRETFHDVREHGDVPRQAEVARKDDEPVRRQRDQAQPSVASFPFEALRRGLQRPKKVRSGRYRGKMRRRR